ncbi:MAG: hypothetical protein WBH14_04195 [Albidovulum sp.]
MQIFSSVRHFLIYFVPGSALALVLGTLSMESAPGLAPIVLLTLGFAAFAVAVGRAASLPSHKSGRGRMRAVEALLELRRHRLRYALVFSLAGTSLTGTALLAIAGAGYDVPMVASPGLFIQVVATLFVVAWVLIGETACTNDAIRRALVAHRDRAFRD